MRIARKALIRFNSDMWQQVVGICLWAQAGLPMSAIM
jgi:hypothetical protein